ncbi:transcriptional regulator [Agrobacterium sp. TS43]|jgi:DNA-binding GntR family transcriptional regulator|uniref:GntR family transcriptional regulator n=1 Tax=Agrobacterium leguminum TaxID=2792015 RepID=A0A9X3HIV1_9HYPH|nr:MULTISPECIES: GntR family transcriptional regulator [Agrobacterium]KDR88403.1 transcriptional regulator [Agrobacterium tumefaciens GW4]KVK41508.1 transcriptional regulator [Agrobacterium sp. D14]KVK52131.1 transcriptional regulator [Agrobacterium sp. JL28]KVK53276.1 transcriptional regulator [Agrobacterium sp. LY4]KVK64473.1 transcriptional regulator [Agrobacterium sp. TS45]
MTGEDKNGTKDEDGNPQEKKRRNSVNLTELAYERIEHLIITCELKPGRFLSIQDLQRETGLSRTPVHQAVSRLAADTLVIIQPRHGLQIAPIDLARERMLLRLRRDLERFVVSLAAEHSTSTHRSQMLHITRILKDQRDTMAIGDFNIFDRRIDKLILLAAGEPFLEHTLRPLHTLFRRIGLIHHRNIGGAESLAGSIQSHIGILEAIAKRNVALAVEASDQLIDYVDRMFDALERDIDPSILDSSLESLISL